MKLFQSTVEKILYLILLLVFTVGTVIGYNALQESKRTQEVLTNNCHLGNEFRETEKSLWEYILNLPPEKPRTPKQQKRVDEFKIFLDEKFMTRDCGSIS